MRVAVGTDENNGHRERRFAHNVLLGVSYLHERVLRVLLVCNGEATAASIKVYRIISDNKTHLSILKYLDKRDISSKKRGQIAKTES